MRSILIVVMLTMGAGAQLTAGDIDDHLNWDAYLRFQDRGEVLFDFSDRVGVQISDGDGRPASNARVQIEDQSGTKIMRIAGSDGRLQIFPGMDGLQFGPLTIEVAGASTVLERGITVRVPTVALPTHLDVMFVIDTTGSMADELSYLAREFEGIVERVAGSNVDARYGLILYKDTYDAYVVKDLGFTDEPKVMQAWLSSAIAGGGGDYPEAMDKALEAAATADWGDGSRLVFLVADAPPHAENYAAFAQATIDARVDGIRIHSIAASGVADEAERLMRGASVATQGRYAWLTDDSGIGNSHAEPKVPCYIVTGLSDLMGRLIESEVAGTRIEPESVDIIRSVGNYERGVCLTEIDPTQIAPDSPDTPAPTVTGSPPTRAPTSTITATSAPTPPAPATRDSKSARMPVREEATPPSALASKLSYLDEGSDGDFYTAYSRGDLGDAHAPEGMSMAGSGEEASIRGYGLDRARGDPTALLVTSTESPTPAPESANVESGSTLPSMLGAFGIVAALWIGGVMVVRMRK